MWQEGRISDRKRLLRWLLFMGKKIRGGEGREKNTGM